MDKNENEIASFDLDEERSKNTTSDCNSIIILYYSINNNCLLVNFIN